MKFLYRNGNLHMTLYISSSCTIQLFLLNNKHSAAMNEINNTRPIIL